MNTNSVVRNLGSWFGSKLSTLRFKINGGTFIFFVIFGDRPPFINFSNFSRGYTEVHKYIIDS